MSRCLRPITVFSGGVEHVVPCGRCYYCRMETRISWDFRLLVESYNWKYSSFVTLTYDDENLPVLHLPFFSPIPVYDFDDLKSFQKSLWNDGIKFKYYAISEYGGKLGRPHFHIMVFSNDLIYFNLYWHKGIVDEMPLHPANVHYITKFHMYPKQSRFLGENMLPPKSYMSKGIGSSFLDSFINTNTGEISELPAYVKYNGYFYPTPRYYRKKLNMPSEVPHTFYYDYLKKKRHDMNDVQIYNYISSQIVKTDKMLNDYIQHSNFI